MSSRRIRDLEACRWRICSFPSCVNCPFECRDLGFRFALCHCYLIVFPVCLSSGECRFLLRKHLETPKLSNYFECVPRPGDPGPSFKSLKAYDSLDFQTAGFPISKRIRNGSSTKVNLICFPDGKRSSPGRQHFFVQSAKPLILSSVVAIVSAIASD